MRIYRFLTASKGVAAVEFALLCPLYIFLVTGMTAYGVYYGAAHSLQQLSADAARIAVAGLSRAERQQLAAAYIAQNSGRYMFVQPDNLSVNIDDSAADGTQFEVTLSYDARVLPIWGLLDGLPMPGQTILRSSTIRIGGL